MLIGEKLQDNENKESDIIRPSIPKTEAELKFEGIQRKRVNNLRIFGN